MDGISALKRGKETRVLSATSEHMGIYEPVQGPLPDTKSAHAFILDFQLLLESWEMCISIVY